MLGFMLLLSKCSLATLFTHCFSIADRMMTVDSEPGSYPRLVADIGGTNARFGWLNEAGATVSAVRRLPVQAHTSPTHAAQAYLGELQSLLGTGYRAPRRAALAVATALDGDQVELTNSHWSFSQARLRADLGLDALLVLNDFEALALSLPRLTASQLACRQPLPAAPCGTLAVIGPGTGLGVGGVVQTRSGWAALSGEGGHATLAAADDFEHELLAHVRREFSHVSAERLLSGIGLPVLHRAVASVLGRPVELLTAEQVSTAARSATTRCALTRLTPSARCSAALPATWRSRWARAAASTSEAASCRGWASAFSTRSSVNGSRPRAASATTSKAFRRR